MSLNLDCLNSYEDISSIVNKSINLIHKTSKSNDKNLFSKLYSLIIDLSFSSNDLEFLLKTPPINSWKFSPKLISSLLIYSSVILFMLLFCSIVFYLISYSNLNKFNSLKSTICIILLNLICLFGFIEMIFILKNVNQTKIYLNQSIKQINQQFNLKTLSEYLLKQLDQFSSKSTPIIINQLKSLIIKSFSDYYSIEQINILINNINQHFNDFNSLIVNKEILILFLNQFTISLTNLINLNKNICHFINENNHHQQIFNSINLIQQQFKFFIQNFNKINFKLFDNKQEEKIQSLISLIANLTLTIISIVTISSLPILILMNLNYRNFHSNHRKTNSKSQYRKQSTLDSLDVLKLQSSHQNNNDQKRHTTHSFRHIDSTSPSKHRSRKGTNSLRHRNGERSCSLPINDLIRNKSKDHRSSYLLICSIRIGFGFLLVVLIVLCLITILLYGVDMLTQSSCRLVHYNQPFLISFITDHFLHSIDGFDVNVTVNNLVDDCNNKIHFSKRFVENYSSELKEELIPIIKELNENIYNQFQMSINIKNISIELDLLNNLANLTGLTNIQNHLILIENDFNQIENIFNQIRNENFQLSFQFWNKTFNQFELVLNNVIESTIDSCPLPLDDLTNLDEFICHKTANTINDVKSGASYTVTLTYGWEGRVQKLSSVPSDPATWAEIKFDLSFMGMTFCAISLIRGFNGAMQFSSHNGSLRTGFTNNLYPEEPAKFKTKDSKINNILQPTQTFRGGTNQKLVNYYRRKVSNSNGYLLPDDYASSHGTKDKRINLAIFSK